MFIQLKVIWVASMIHLFLAGPSSEMSLLQRLPLPVPTPKLRHRPKQEERNAEHEAKCAESHATGHGDIQAEVMGMLRFFPSARPPAMPSPPGKVNPSANRLSRCLAWLERQPPRCALAFMKTKVEDL